MPKVKWSELIDIVHDCKNTLQVFYGIEKMCQTVRERMGNELEKLNEITLHQVTGEMNDIDKICTKKDCKERECE